MTPAISLEPRVVSLEAHLETLTTDVRDLTSIVRAQGEKTESQIQSLVVAITNAGAPRKTDWGVWLGAAALIMSIGAAAFSPLFLRLNDLSASQQQLAQQFNEHERLKLHPVGEARIEMLEKMIDMRFKAVDEMSNVKLQLTTKATEERIADLAREFHVVRSDGSPVTRERLSLLEGQYRKMDEDIRDTRNRLNIDKRVSDLERAAPVK